MTDIYENNDDIDYSIMQFTPLPHVVGKIWLDSDSEDSEDDDEPVIESWAKNDDNEDDIKPTVSFEELEEIEEQKEIENSYDYKQKNLYHPPTQAEFLKKYSNRNLNNTENDNNTDEDDEKYFDDVNEFAILAVDNEPTLNDETEIVLGQKEQPQQQKQEEVPQKNENIESHEKENEISKIHNITIEKPLKKETDHKVNIVKKNGYCKELKELQICLKNSERN